MAAAPPDPSMPTMDDLLAKMKHFMVSSRPPQTREERDDPTTIYNVRTLADLTREVLKRGESIEPSGATRK